MPPLPPTGTAMDTQLGSKGTNMEKSDLLKRLLRSLRSESAAELM